MVINGVCRSWDTMWPKAWSSAFERSRRAACSCSMRRLSKRSTKMATLERSTHGSKGLVM